MANQNFLSYARLQFHIENPTVEETWVDGYECGKSNVDESSNPYEHGSSEYFHWQEGWWAGFYDEEPLFNLGGDVNTVLVHNQSHQQVATTPISINNLYNQTIDRIQNSKLYIRSWHLLTGVLGYLVVYELLDIFVSVE